MLVSDTRDDVVTTIRNNLIDLPVELVVEQTEASSPDLFELHSKVQAIAERVRSRAVFFADFSDPDRTVLYVSIPKSGTTLIRHINCKEETLISRHTATAVIIRSIIVAMLGGGEIGIHVPSTPSPPPPVEPPPPPDSSVPKEKKAARKPPKKETSEVAKRRASRLQLETAYLGSLFFSEDQFAVHGLRSAVTGFPGSFAYLFAGYRLMMPFTNELSVGENNLRLCVSPHPIEVGIGGRISQSQLDLRLGGAFLLDLITWDVMTLTYDEDLEDDTLTRKSDTGVRLALAPFVSAGWPISETMTIYLAVSAEFAIQTVIFKVKVTEDKARSLSETSFLNLSIQTGLRFSLD